jgi:hypothetical protein
MENAITTVPKPPEVTLSVDATVWMGRNQIRRNIGKSTSLYICKSVVDRTVNLLPGETFTAEPDILGPLTVPPAPAAKIKALSIVTSSPVSVVLNGGAIFLNVSRYLFLDSDIEDVQVTNDVASTEEARISLSYAY